MTPLAFARAAVDVVGEADALLAGMAAEPWGQASPSVYETGRLVALAPGLTGHERRVGFLVRTQQPYGGWGPPEPGYALVPTLSATDALLSAGRTGSAAAPGPGAPPYGERAGSGVGAGPRTSGAPASGERTWEAAAAGLRTLFRWLRGPGALTAADLPDLPAIELIVPSLIRSINRRLDALAAPASGWWPGEERLCCPSGMDGTALDPIRERLTAGRGVPAKLLHALEVAGDRAYGHPLIRPETTGTVGASPAATVAWLGDPAEGEEGSPAWSYLERAARRHGGPVPCALPITVFERAWVLGWLARAGVPVTPPPELVRSLAAAVGPDGAAAAAGLPHDADTTAGALYALALCGAPRSPDALRPFASGGHFCTWPGEDGVSVSTNAHVLEAFGQYGRVAGAAEAEVARAARRAGMANVAAWLRDRQRPDGSWEDRWHASPYYATSCAALALHAFGGPESASAVARAVRWVLASRRLDGGWGCWESSAEETAYAVQILLLTARGPAAGEGAASPALAPAGSGPSGDRAVGYPESTARPADGDGLDDEVRVAAAVGCEFLLRCRPGADGPALWHDKDLYRPTAIVRAAVLAALHLGRRHGLLPGQEESEESDISA